MTEIGDRIATLSPEQRTVLMQRLRDKVETARRQIVPQDRSRATFPLSFAQERLWFINQMGRDNGLYNISAAIRVTGPLHSAVLEQSVSEIVRRHESLRTTFHAVDGQPVQKIHAAQPVHIPVIDIRHLTRNHRASQTKQFIDEITTQPFDLSAGPLLRLSVIRTDVDEYMLLVVIHHIVSDGLSTGLFLRELWEAYDAFLKAQPAALPELLVQYVDFAVWQRQWLQGAVLEEQLDYWKRQLANVPTLALPTDRSRPAIQSSDGAYHSFKLSKELTEALEAFSQREGVTLYMTLLTSFKALLYRYSGQAEIVVGSPIANRARPEIAPLLGFFVNNLVLRTDFAGDPSFRDAVRRVRQVAMDAYQHQDVPFERLVEALHVERDLSRSPLFQVAFALQENPVGNSAAAGLHLHLMEIHSGSAKFDITLELFKLPRGLSGWFEYNSALFDAATIDRMANHLQTLLESIVADGSQRLSELPILTAGERNQIVQVWNATQTPYAHDKCAHQLFEAQVDRVPGAVAAVFEDESLTYRELNRRANQLAHYLRAQGIEPDTLVGLCIERSLDMVVGIMGILKAGGAYVPLDPTYPKDRLAYMVADSCLPLLITQEHLVSRLPEHNATVLCIDSAWAEIAQYADTNPANHTASDNLAYVIYTSGSTGRPKGVLLEHQGLANLSAAQKAAFGVSEGSRILQFASFSFDASVWETVMALLNGASLYLVRAETLKLGGVAVANVLRDNAISHVTLPPSLLATMPPIDLPALRTIVSAGESCSTDIVARWAPGRQFVNAYGPTETTVCASMTVCHAEDDTVPSIGTPLPNMQLYILDGFGNPVPVNIPGELHIGGVGLARGYLNQPELTAQKFIADPFSTDPKARLYKTGDLARYLPNGTIEFLGRIDHQVKIRGFRIELGEIEAALRLHEALQDAVVTAREDTPGDKRLVAYIVPQPGALPSLGELRRFLKERVPDYMIPAAFVVLGSLPLTPNGKVDKKALPAPEMQVAKVEASYINPQNEAERTIAAIWQEVLHGARVGSQDNFFDLGGHSLLMVQVHTKLQEAFAREIAIIDLFQYPTVSTLAKFLGQAQDNAPSTAIQQSQDRARKQREALSRQRQPRQGGR